MIARILMGLGFTAFGIIGLFNLIPPPKTLPPGVGEFMAGLKGTHYFFPLLFGTQLLVGLLLLLNLFAFEFVRTACARPNYACFGKHHFIPSLP
jgi:hypothetical protein